MCNLVLFDPLIGPYQVLPLQVRVDQGAIAMKGYSTFPKAPALLQPHHEIVYCNMQDTRWGSFTLLKRSSWCILQPQPNGQTNVLDMALHHLMIRLKSQSFLECGVPLHCHYSLVHSDFEGAASDRVLSIGQIELFDILNWGQTNDLYSTESLEIQVFDHLTVCKLMTDVKL